MPELPEVETVKRCLEKQILGKTINEVFIGKKKLRIDYPKNLSRNINKQKIKEIKRRSKYILIELSNDNTLVIHLGMSGKILFNDSLNQKTQKHDHFIIRFSDDSQIIFNDPRRFGLVTLIKNTNINSHILFKELGPEPFSKQFNGDYLKKIFQNKKQSVKQSLMDARNLVGVGNIYASEALFRTGINPKTSAGKIDSKKLNNLAENIRLVLKEAIRSGGSTLRDYVRSDGDIGYFQHKFKVYGREKSPCVSCGTEIKRIVQQGRSTYYCANCQK